MPTNAPQDPRPDTPVAPEPKRWYPASIDDWRLPYDGQGMYFATEADAYWDALDKQLSEALATVEHKNKQIERLTDLVRYMRHELHEGNLITDEEYAALVADSEGGKRVARLEGYDAMRATVERLTRAAKESLHQTDCQGECTSVDTCAHRKLADVLDSLASGKEGDPA